jgi:hypothetical protein
MSLYRYHLEQEYCVMMSEFLQYGFFCVVACFVLLRFRGMYSTVIWRTFGIIYSTYSSLDPRSCSWTLHNLRVDKSEYNKKKYYVLSYCCNLQWNGDAGAGQVPLIVRWSTVSPREEYEKPAK